MKYLQRFRESREYRRAYKRLSSVGDHHVLDWAMTSLWATQAALEAAGRASDRVMIREAQQGAVALLAATDVLLDRND